MSQPGLDVDWMRDMLKLSLRDAARTAAPGQLLQLKNTTKNSLAQNFYEVLHAAMCGDAKVDKRSNLYLLITLPESIKPETAVAERLDIAHRMRQAVESDTNFDDSLRLVLFLWSICRLGGLDAARRGHLGLLNEAAALGRYFKSVRTDFQYIAIFIPLLEHCPRQLLRNALISSLDESLDDRVPTTTSFRAQIRQMDNMCYNYTSLYAPSTLCHALATSFRSFVAATSAAVLLRSITTGLTDTETSPLVAGWKATTLALSEVAAGEHHRWSDAQLLARLGPARLAVPTIPVMVGPSVSAESLRGLELPSTAYSTVAFAEKLVRDHKFVPAECDCAAPEYAKQAVKTTAEYCDRLANSLALQNGTTVPVTPFYAITDNAMKLIVRQRGFSEFQFQSGASSSTLSPALTTLGTNTLLTFIRSLLNALHADEQTRALNDADVLLWAAQLGGLAPAGDSRALLAAGVVPSAEMLEGDLQGMSEGERTAVMVRLFDVLKQAGTHLCLAKGSTPILQELIRAFKSRAKTLPLNAVQMYDHGAALACVNSISSKLLFSVDSAYLLPPREPLAALLEPSFKTLNRPLPKPEEILPAFVEQDVQPTLGLVPGKTVLADSKNMIGAYVASVTRVRAKVRAFMDTPTGKDLKSVKLDEIVGVPALIVMNHSLRTDVCSAGLAAAHKAHHPSLPPLQPLLDALSARSTSHRDKSLTTIVDNSMNTTAFIKRIETNRSLRCDPSGPALFPRSHQVMPVTFVTLTTTGECAAYLPRALEEQDTPSINVGGHAVLVRPATEVMLLTLCGTAAQPLAVVAVSADEKWGKGRHHLCRVLVVGASAVLLSVGSVPFSKHADSVLAVEINENKIATQNGNFMPFTHVALANYDGTFVLDSEGGNDEPLAHPCILPAGKPKFMHSNSGLVTIRAENGSDTYFSAVLNNKGALQLVATTPQSTPIPRFAAPAVTPAGPVSFVLKQLSKRLEVRYTVGK